MNHVFRDFDFVGVHFKWRVSSARNPWIQIMGCIFP